MADYKDILLMADYDRTLTGPDATIPKNNIEAILFFMKNGGSFTVNTGRTIPSFRHLINTIPANAPFLLYNGSAAYDKENEKLWILQEIRLEWTDVRRRILERFPKVLVEYQGVDAHYLHRQNLLWEQYCKTNGYAWDYAWPGKELGPFLKFCVYGKLSKPDITHLFHGTSEEVTMMDEVESWLRREFAGKCEITRGANLYIDVQPIGVSKGRSALILKKTLGKKILVCVGDAENDVSMLDDADYGFCPSDAIVKDRYPNLCDCADGVLADLIYHRIPNL